MIGKRGRDLVRSFEQCRLEAYKDSGGVCTLGWGRTRGIKDGDTCTQDQADDWLIEDMAVAEDAVDMMVKHPISEAQKDALTSFVYNVGARAFQSSLLLEQVNGGHHFAAARAFLNYTFAGGGPLRGLLRRRLAEAALYAEDPWIT